MYGVFNNIDDNGIYMPDLRGLTPKPLADPHYPTLVTFARETAVVNWNALGVFYGHSNGAEQIGVRRENNTTYRANWNNSRGSTGVTPTLNEFFMMAFVFNATGAVCYYFGKSGIQKVTDAAMTNTITQVPDALLIPTLAEARSPPIAAGRTFSGWTYDSRAYAGQLSEGTLYDMWKRPWNLYHEIGAVSYFFPAVAGLFFTRKITRGITEAITETVVLPLQS